MAGGLLGGLLGAVLGGGDTPKVSNAAAADTADAKRTANTARSALYETAGGAAGEELDPDAVEKRRTLLGN